MDQTSKNQIENFWNWFLKNNKKFVNILQEEREKQNKLVDEILSHLHKYCPHIWIQLGGDSDDYTEMIFTAEGNTDYYQPVKDLVLAAPAIEKWKIIALMPPLEINEVTYDDGLQLSVTELAYGILINSEDVSAICLSIYVKDYETRKDHASFQIAVHKLLDLILGEECYGYVSTVDIEAWEDDTESNILNLRNYILTKKEAYSEQNEE
jgi:hypothetical protein